MAAKGLARVCLLFAASLLILWAVVAVVYAQPVEKPGESIRASPFVSVPSPQDAQTDASSIDDSGSKGLTGPALAGTVNIALSPLTTTVYVGDVFMLDVMVNAGSQSVDGVDVYLNFDAGKLHVVDAAGADTTAIIADTTTFSSVLQNVADNTTGHIDYSAGSLSGSAGSGSFRVAQIRFKAMAGSSAAGTPVTFNRSIPRLTDVAWAGSSVFGSATDASAVIISTFTIPLTTSWNLISTPLSPISPSVTTTLMSITGHYSVVEAYDAFSQTWKIYNKSFPPDLNTLTQITETLGIWIRISDPVTLTVTGTVPVSSGIPLAAGWNLVGYPSLVTRPVTVAFATIDGKYNVVEAYDAFSQTWKIYNKNFPPDLNTLTDMSPGWGYWIRTTQACIWSLP